MAPSPENDSAPKAPDKAKAKGPGGAAGRAAAPPPPPSPPTTEKESAVSGLNDTQLRALLDEAITYKLPKDRHGKSPLFLNLLDQAEEDDRKARATSASGSELVRYYNTTATRRTRHRKGNKSASVSESLAQGGSLNNLAKELLYEVAGPLYRPPKTVSARQRQGGSLPCNVNAGLSLIGLDFDAVRKKAAAHAAVERAAYTDPNNVDEEEKRAALNELESQRLSLLDNDLLSRDYGYEKVVRARAPKYTTRLNLEIGKEGGAAAEGAMGGQGEEGAAYADRALDADNPYKVVETVGAGSHYLSSCNFQMPGAPFYTAPKKLDENGNALAQSIDAKKLKKKKNQVDKNVVSVKAAFIIGHRSDIIDDVDKLTEYIYGTDDPAKQQQRNTKSKWNKHGAFSVSEDKGKKQQQQRVRAKQGGKEREKLKKSNSLEEMSTTKRDEFAFDEETDVTLRSGKTSVERRERRSWGNSEPLQSLQLYANASAENLETADFRVVTKKKKSRKQQRRNNSLNGRGQSYGHSAPTADAESSSSSSRRRKSACSVPHSEKSNDSSDADSVHSLPIDSHAQRTDEDRLHLPISYADIARNSATTPNHSSSNNGKQRAAVEGVAPTPLAPPPPLAPVVNAAPIAAQVSQATAQTQTHPLAAVAVCVAPAHAVAPPPPPTLCTVDVNIQNWPAIPSHHHHHHHNNNSNNRAIVTRNNHANLYGQVVAGAAAAPRRRIDDLDIPDVQTIEKMHMREVRAQKAAAAAAAAAAVATATTYCVASDACAATGGAQQRTSRRPPVVISGASCNDVSGLTFGFDVNEELLLTTNAQAPQTHAMDGNADGGVCDTFAARFHAPDTYRNVHHDSLVNFIGLAWEDIVNQSNGKVKYFSDQL